MLANETELPNPLTGDEVKDGIAHKVAVAVRERLDKSCRLYGKSYPKFKASVRIEIVLDNFGLTYEDNSMVVLDETLGETIQEPETVEIDLDIPETPPNQFRRETEQPVPTAVTGNGRTEEKAVLYQPRGRGRPKTVR